MVGSTSANSLHRPHRSAAASPSVVRADAAAESADPQLVAELRNEINALVQEVSQLATQDLSPEAFFSAILSRIVTAMGAAGGAVWTTGDGSGLTPLCQERLDQTGALASSMARARHGLLLQAVLAGKQAVVAPPGIGPASDTQAGNPTELLLVLAPLMIESEPYGIVEIFQRAGASASAQRGYVRFLTQMCDVAAGYLQTRKLRQVAENQVLWREIEGLVQSLYRSLDVRETAYAIVNDGRRMIGCDRVSLALAYGGHCRIEAVSGLDSIDRRAAEARQLARLAEMVLQAREPLWSDAGDELPPQVQGPLSDYVDRSHARLVAVLPLVRPAPGDAAEQHGGHSLQRPFGALIIEQLRDSRAGETLRTRSNVVAQHSAAAISHAIEHSSVFLLPLWKTLGQATWIFRGSALVKTFIVLAAIAGAIYALAVVPTDFEVAARGKLQPAERREIFAPLDGVVARVPVEHGQIVESGAVLAELTSTDLDLELAALIGRQTTNHERLAALERAMLDTKGGAARLSPADENRLAGEQLEYRQEAQNIQRELVLVRDKQQKLTITAPQRGQVVTWKVRDLLLQRPVVRGQGLLTLANPDGPWELELHLPERRLKHLQTAAENVRQKGGTPQATFVLSSHPGQTFRGRVVEIEQTAEVRGDEGNTVLVRVAVEKAELPPLHDQTTVTAKINCGRTSLGYAWFCDLIETVQSHVLFWLPS